MKGRVILVKVILMKVNVVIIKVKVMLMRVKVILMKVGWEGQFTVKVVH